MAPAGTTIMGAHDGCRRPSWHFDSAGPPRRRALEPARAAARPAADGRPPHARAVRGDRAGSGGARGASRHGRRAVAPPGMGATSAGGGAYGAGRGSRRRVRTTRTAFGTRARPAARPPRAPPPLPACGHTVPDAALVWHLPLLWHSASLPPLDVRARLLSAASRAPPIV